MVQVGEQVKRLREERGWSQPRLAVEAGVAVSAVSQIENGRRSPNVSTLDKLAEAFGVGVAEFFPKAQRRSLPEPSLFSDLEDERPSVAVDGIFGVLERWHERRLAEVRDSASLHFRDPTSAALWIADTREEANEFCIFVSEWMTERPEAVESIGDALHLFSAGLMLENPADAGETRLQEMEGIPDELAARRKDRATDESRASMARLQELRDAATG